VPPRYQISLASNIGLVQVLPYGQPITTGSANFGPSTGQTSRNWIDFGHLYRARQNGTVTQVKVNVPSIAGITGFYISNCRSGAVAATTPNNVDVITTSQNMALSLISGVNTLTLSSPLNMQWGDYICGRIEWSGGATVQNLATSPATSATGETAAIYYVDNVIPSATSYDWTAVSSSTGNVMLVEADMTPPLFACTADSIGSGAITAYSFSDTYSTLTAGNVSYCDLVGLALNVPVQNFGHAGFTTNQIWTEFAKGPAKVAPKYVVLEGGVNDILGGTETLAQIQTQWTNILNSTQALGAVPIVLGILPFSSGGTTPPTAQMQLGDQVNAWLASQTAAYGGIYVNTAPYLGLYDPRGPAGNLWLMNTQYYPNGSGNVHPGPLGYKRVAQAILDGLSASNSIGNPPAPPATSFAAGTGDSTGMVRSFGVGTYSSGSPAAEMYYSGAAFFDCYNRPSTPCVTNVGITSVGGSGISFGLSQTATMYGNFQLSNGQFTGLLQGAGMMRSTGSSTTGATAGLGAEMFVSGSTGIFDCYNRTAAAACKAQFGQSTVGMTADPTGNAVLIFGSTLTVAPNTTFT
jgi:lysophospholipase L1-like esterase